MRATIAPCRLDGESTTAWGGMPSHTSCAAPVSRIGHSRPLSAGSGCSRKALSTCSSSPCRRSTVAAIARARARSRASSVAPAGGSPAPTRLGRTAAWRAARRTPAVRQGCAPPGLAVPVPASAGRRFFFAWCARDSCLGSRSTGAEPAALLPRVQEFDQERKMQTPTPARLGVRRGRPISRPSCCRC